MSDAAGKKKPGELADSTGQGGLDAVNVQPICTANAEKRQGDGLVPDLAHLTDADLLRAAAVSPPPTNGTGPASPGGGPTPAAPTLPESEYLTDLGNAKRLVRLHGDDLRHVAAWGWLCWDGRRWERDETGEHVRRAKRVALSFYDDAQRALDRAKKAAAEAQQAQDAGDTAASEAAVKRMQDAQRLAGALAGWGKTSQARGRIEGMVKLAESEELTATRADLFDAQPWLLNVANGTLDLRTGTLRAHDRADMLTKCSPVAYHPSAICPRWLAFLDRIMGGDPKDTKAEDRKKGLISFLQRVVGYCLTGDVSEQSLFFLHGAGQNGKSTFLRTILAMLGRDYAMQAAADVLITGKDRHPTELADLAGARLVASIEVEEGKRLAEALVKQLTGGDPVKARFMRCDFFQFDPTFKLLMAANHKPAIRGTDFAIWRRVKLIPFTVVIPDDEKDPHLGEKLLGELPGILAWAVAGCLAWQGDGLQVPAAVKEATEAYRAEQDLLGSFLAECTEKGGQAQAGPLFSAYLEWARLPKEQEPTRAAFGKLLKERGYDKYTDDHTRRTYYMGLTLQPNADAKTQAGGDGGQP